MLPSQAAKGNLSQREIATSLGETAWTSGFWIGNSVEFREAWSGSVVMCRSSRL